MYVCKINDHPVGSHPPSSEGYNIFFFVRGTISPFYGKRCSRGVIFKTFLGGST